MFRWFFKFNQIKKFFQLSKFIVKYDLVVFVWLLYFYSVVIIINNYNLSTSCEFIFQVQEKNQKLRELEADLLHRVEQMRELFKAQELEHESARRAFEIDRSTWEENWREWDIGSDIGTNGPNLGLGERVMNEVIKERAKTEKKKKGLF